MMATQILTQKRLKELLHYDPKTGVFTYIRARSKVRVGDVAGTSGTRGYLQCNIDGKPYKLHRLAWLYVHGVWPTYQIDHINHNTADNRIANLRDVSCAHNHQNRNRRTKSASGYLGVTWHKRDRKWQAHIEVNSKPIHLGSYTSLTDAITARLAAERVHHKHRPEVQNANN
jgi:hypothetical protein